MTTSSNWNASDFFRRLTESNKLAQNKQFCFARVSGLDGFEEALGSMQSNSAFVCVSEVAQGYTDINNTPHTRRVKTVFLAMRHALNDMEERQACMNTMHELFRQFMSQLILEKTRLAENRIYLNDRITFNEIDEYFFSGCACTYFQISVDVYTDLRFNPQEWTA